MEEIGEILLKSSSPYRLEWIIPDFLSRLQKLEMYDSPKFLFCNQDTKLRICKYSATSEYVLLALRNYSSKTHYIIYNVNIYNVNGGEFESAVDKSITFNAAETLLYFASPVKLLEDQGKVAVGGNWTISCLLQCVFHYDESVSMPIVEDIKNFLKYKERNFKEKVVSKNARKGVSPNMTDSEMLKQDMKALFSTGLHSDVTLVVGDRKFSVHRAILGIRSPVFAEMFGHHVGEKARERYEAGSPVFRAMFSKPAVLNRSETAAEVVNITDFDPDVFHEFLLYLYTANVQNLSSKIVFGLYSAADKYDTQGLKAKCVKFMIKNLSLDIICSVISLALKHEELSLLEAATKFFAKNLKHIIVTVEWQAFLKKYPVAANDLLIKATTFYVLEEEKL